MIIKFKNQWLSEFFGIEIYEYHDLNYSKELNIKESKKVKFLLVEPSQSNNIPKGYQFLQTKVTFIKKPTITKGNNDNKVNHLNDSRKSNISIEDFEMFVENSRFKIFSRNKVIEFYYTWLINSINGKKDQKVIGIKDNISKKLMSFLTYNINENIISIGLFGTFNQYLKKGYATTLMNELEIIAISNKCSQILVSTQGHNIEAMNFYIKSGFKIKSVEYWYYSGDIV